MTTCSECKRRREDVVRAQRFGGGSYRRSSRWYATTVCRECATRAIDYADAQRVDPGKVWMLSVSTLRHKLNRPRADTPDPPRLTSGAT